MIMKKWISMLLLVTLACSLCPFALADQLTEPLSEAVPFGIAHAKDAGALAVYRTPNARNRIDALRDYQVCAILSAKVSGGSNWYEIRYVSGNSFKEGYISGDVFYPLTLAGLIAVTGDADAAAALRTLAGASDASVFVSPSPTASPRPTATPKAKATPRPTATPKAKATPRPTATPSSGRKKYVLNTKTLKFHLPNCSETDRITDENRKNTTTTREALIDQGYTPCQKCNP